MSFFFEGVQRLDWLGNPNRTAALIAMLACPPWWLAARWRPGFWLALGLSVIPGVLLVQTFSRGGMAAYGVGLACLASFAPRPWPRGRMLAVVGALLGLLLYAHHLSAMARYAQAWQGDPSVLNRLTLWARVPTMIADAPWGWGLGQAQTAYMNWYQPLDHSERFLNLVSLHLTLLAELPWPLRFLYLLGWLLALTIAWPRRLPRRDAVPFAILATAFVAGVSTHFTDVWVLYLLPALAFGWALFCSWREGRLPSIKVVAVEALLAGVGLAAIVGWGQAHRLLLIRGNADWVVVGAGEPRGWVVPEASVMGLEYGRTLRRLYPEAGQAPALGFVTKAKSLPTHPGLLVLGGGGSVDQIPQSAPARLLWLNPTRYPVEIERLFPAVPVKVVFGEFSMSPSLSIWTRQPNCRLVSGVGDYLSDWPGLIFDSLREQ